MAPPLGAAAEDDARRSWFVNHRRGQYRAVLIRRIVER